MLVSSKQVANVFRSGPVFKDLLDLYEENYRLLMALVPDLELLDTDGVTQEHDNLTFYVALVERCKYTTTIRMTYRYQDQSQNWLEPDLKIRVYHDARMAEAYRVHGHISLGELKPGCEESRSPLEWKWEMNTFLNKWMLFCIQQGYSITENEILLAADISAESETA